MNNKDFLGAVTHYRCGCMYGNTNHLIIESFRFQHKDKYKCESFSLLSSAFAWTNVILMGKRDICRHSTTSFGENVIVTETSYQTLEV